jgi:hypothetical protein
LKNLLGVSLESIVPDKVQVIKLMASAQRNLADAQLAGLSTENRFDLAYKAVMQLALLALHANGYRTLTSKPGHHATAIQSLTLTANLAQSEMIVLDALRKQRNLADYSGDIIADGAAQQCLLSAKNLLVLVRDWLKLHKPELI